MTLFGIQMLEVLYTNVYSLKFVSKFVSWKYTNSRMLIYQRLFNEICILRVYQRGCLGGAHTEKVIKNILF